MYKAQGTRHHSLEYTHTQTHEIAYIWQYVQVHYYCCICLNRLFNTQMIITMWLASDEWEGAMNRPSEWFLKGLLSFWSCLYYSISVGTMSKNGLQPDELTVISFEYVCVGFGSIVCVAKGIRFLLLPIPIIYHIQLNFASNFGLRLKKPKLISIHSHSGTSLHTIQCVI